MSCFYYTQINQQFLPVYLSNFGITAVFSIVLYLLHIWAGGDSKLLITASLLYPAAFCFSYRGFQGTFALTIPFSFAIGFIFLVLMSLVLFFKEKKKIDAQHFFSAFLLFMKRYAVMLLYTTLVNLIIQLFIPATFRYRSICLLCICFCIPWIIQKLPWMKNKAVLVIIFIIDAALLLLTKSFGTILNPTNLLIVLVSACLQILLADFMYKTIPTSEIRKGMILSLSSSLLFMNSKVQGLPGLSTEDLASRLTETEAESIRRWAATDKGKKEIIIVRKVPFAVFITLGILFYFMIWYSVV